MKIMIAASATTKPFQPFSNARPMVCLAFGVAVAATGSGLTLNCTRSVASETRSLMARFIAVYCSTKVSRSVS